jgi:hypothetical protein
MAYTLAEAAKACGLDKSTLRRAVRSGRISGTRNDDGVWHVEPVELHRVYPLARTEVAPEATPQDAPSDSALVTELRTVIADLRSDRDAWREQAQRLALPRPAEKKLPWWRLVTQP